MKNFSEQNQKIDAIDAVIENLNDNTAKRVWLKTVEDVLAYDMQPGILVDYIEARLADGSRINFRGTNGVADFITYVEDYL